MTKQLFLEDSYLQEFKTKITKIDNNNLDIYLDRTAFYPGGGGQPNDVGKIIIKKKEYAVVKVARNSKREIFHRLKQPIEAIKGDEVLGKIDWDRRYTLMKYHSALHILCGLIWKEFGASVTGGKMYLDRARMDFNLEDFSKDRVQYIEQRVKEEIDASHEIIIKTLPREEAFKIPDLIRTKINLLPPSIKEVRTVEIVGLDLQADGGTHVKNTSEIGKVSIIDTINKGKDNKRIVIKLD